MLIRALFSVLKRSLGVKNGYSQEKENGKKNNQGYKGRFEKKETKVKAPLQSQGQDKKARFKIEIENEYAARKSQNRTRNAHKIHGY